MITMLGLFIVVTYVEQRLIVLPNTTGKMELYGSNPCLCHASHPYLHSCFFLLYLWFDVH